MLGFGVKRKLDEDEDRLEADGGVLSSARQRQTLLNVSLCKLYGPRTGGVLGLQRRVLINNVIRRLHAGVGQDGGADPGGGAGLFFFAAAPPVSAAANEDERFRPPPPPSSFSLLSSPLSGPTAPDSCLTPASLLEDDQPVFFAPPPSQRPPSPPPKDSFSSALEEIEELCPSSPPPPAARVLIDAVMKEEGRGLQEKPPPPLLPPPPSPGSFLTDFSLDDVLFTDIDTSMYDLGPGPPPPSKPHPAMTADDLVRSLSAGYAAAAGGGAQTQPFKMDLAELDQIMEVLVGS